MSIFPVLDALQKYTAALMDPERFVATGASAFVPIPSALTIYDIERGLDNRSDDFGGNMRTQCPDELVYLLAGRAPSPTIRRDERHMHVTIPGGMMRQLCGGDAFHVPDVTVSFNPYMVALAGGLTLGGVPGRRGDLFHQGALVLLGLDAEKRLRDQILSNAGQDSSAAHFLHALAETTLRGNISPGRYRANADVLFQAALRAPDYATRTMAIDHLAELATREYTGDIVPPWTHALDRLYALLRSIDKDRTNGDERRRTNFLLQAIIQHLIEVMHAHIQPLRPCDIRFLRGVTTKGRALNRFIRADENRHGAFTELLLRAHQRLAGEVSDDRVNVLLRGLGLEAETAPHVTFYDALENAVGARVADIRFYLGTALPDEPASHDLLAEALLRAKQAGWTAEDFQEYEARWTRDRARRAVPHEDAVEYRAGMLFVALLDLPLAALRQMHDRKISHIRISTQII